MRNRQRVRAFGLAPKHRRQLQYLLVLERRAIDLMNSPTYKRLNDHETFGTESR